jgi:hypothetical protein
MIGGGGGRREGDEGEGDERRTHEAIPLNKESGGENRGT